MASQISARRRILRTTITFLRPNAIDLSQPTSTKAKNETDKIPCEIFIDDSHKAYSDFKNHVCTKLELAKLCKEKAFCSDFAVELYRVERDRTGKQKERVFSLHSETLWPEVGFPRLMEGPPHGIADELAVHVVCEVTKWVEGKVLIISPTPKHSEDLAKQTPESKKRKSRRESLEDLAMCSARKDHVPYVRNARQAAHFDEMTRAFAACRDSAPTHEGEVRCGVCHKILQIPGKRSVDGKVAFFKRRHFDSCSANEEKRASERRRIPKPLEQMWAARPRVEGQDIAEGIPCKDPHATQVSLFADLDTDDMGDFDEADMGENFDEADMGDNFDEMDMGENFGEADMGENFGEADMGENFGEADTTLFADSPVSLGDSAEIDTALLVDGSYSSVLVDDPSLDQPARVEVDVDSIEKSKHSRMSQSDDIVRERMELDEFIDSDRESSLENSESDDNDDDHHAGYFTYDSFPWSFQEADPLAQKLHDIRKNGKMPKDSLMYVYLDNVFRFALRRPGEPFKWDDKLCEFFSTLDFQSSHMIPNLFRGPGFFGTGKGGDKQFTSFADWNLCGPSLTTLQKYVPGHTTRSGVQRENVAAFYKFADESHAPTSSASSARTGNSRLLEKTDSLHVIPVILANDGTAVKAGLTFDPTYKKIVGATVPIDDAFMEANPKPDPQFLKSKMVTEADVTFSTTVDNAVSIPIGVRYGGKGSTGEQTLEDLKQTVLAAQICEACLRHADTEEFVLDTTDYPCRSRCDACVSRRDVCENCLSKGHRSWIPSMRACDRCLFLERTCVRSRVLLTVTDCEEKNRKCLDLVHDRAEEIDYMYGMTAIPDVVHLGKTCKNGAHNWFIIDEDGRRFTLPFVRTLRESARSEPQNVLKKKLTLECVRNRDRMAVEPIVLLTRPVILHALTQCVGVVHTIVPEKFRKWDSNMPGKYPPPLGICAGATGHILVLTKPPVPKSTTKPRATHNKPTKPQAQNSTKKSETPKSFSLLLNVRLHNPCDVRVVAKDIAEARSLAFVNGIAYVGCTRGIRFIAISGKVELEPKKITKEQIKDELRKRNTRYVEGANKDTLQQKLEQVLTQQKGAIPNEEKGLLKMPEDSASEANALSVYAKNGKDYLLAADNTKREVMLLDCESDGVRMTATASRLIPYPPDVHEIVDLCSENGHVYLATRSGLYVYSDASKTVDKVHDHCTLAVTFANGLLYFTDEKRKQVFSLSSSSEVQVYAGCESDKYGDGDFSTASFKDISCLCREFNTIYVGDLKAVRVAVPTDGLVEFLSHLGCLYDCFGIHAKGISVEKIETAVILERLDQMIAYHERLLQNAVKLQKLDRSTLNGPEGAISDKFRTSLSLLKCGLQKLKDVLTQNPSLKLDPQTLLTVVVENLHAVSHFRTETFTVYEHARDYGRIVKESFKRQSKSLFHYYTHKKSYYPIPHGSLESEEIPTLPHVKPKCMSKEKEERFRNYISNYRPMRQQTVRGTYTKDKAGVLPVALYQCGDDTIDEAVGEEGVDELMHDEYDVSDDEESDNTHVTNTDDLEINVDEHPALFMPSKSRSGRTVKATVRLDL